MTLSLREKKLAIGYLSAKALVDNLIETFGDSVLRTAAARGRAITDSAVFSGFDASDMADIRELDAQIPKE